MSHRTQITLSDGQYVRLRERAQQSGSSIAELIRRAVDEHYGPDDLTLAEKLELVRQSAGAWKDRDFDGAEYVERIRSPGLGHRLQQLGL